LLCGGDLEGTQLYTLLGPKQFTSEFDKSQFSLDLNDKLSKLIPEAPKPPQVEVETEITDNTGNTGGGGRAPSGATHKEVRRKVTVQVYKTGGLAPFTGPAWLDGTPSKPEYVLNAQQTERFFSLIDVLEGIDTKETGAKKSGDSYFDININVEKIEDDYDVE
jgi:hypothetical protein